MTTGGPIRARAVRAAMALAILASVAIPAAAPPASAAACQSWSPIPRSPGAEGGRLRDVAVLSPCRAWAVGVRVEGGAELTLIERWNGTRWSIVPSPNPSPSANQLQGVTANGPDDVWAVGYTIDPDRRPLALHWNGRKWREVPTPTVNDGEFEAVSAAGPDDVWAVGVRQQGGQTRSLIARWNGRRWRLVDAPQVGTGENSLFGVHARTPGDVWAVGRRENDAGTASLTLTLRWNGRTWKHKRSPSLPSGGNELIDVFGVSRSSAWAVGTSFGALNESILLRWNGRSWKPTPHPTVADDDHNLNGVVATSSTNAWATGAACSSGGVCSSLVLRWNGRSWRVQPSASAEAADTTVLYGVDASSPRDAWAVGLYRDGSQGIENQPFAVHCC
jgi:hypothetical protein